MRDRCWMIPKGGGGSPLASQSKLIVRRTAAIGDALCASVVSDRLVQLGYVVEYQTHPHVQCVMRRQPNIIDVTTPKGHCHVDLDQTYEKDPNRRTKHFHQMFFEAAQRQLTPMGINLGLPRNCKPKLIVMPHEQAAATANLEPFPRPWVFICPRSNFYAARTVQDFIWEEMAREVAGTKFWLGTHAKPPQNIVDLKIGNLEQVIQYLSVADILVSVDTGPLHIAAAVGCPIVAVSQSSAPHWHLNDQTDFIEVEPPGLDCLDCQLNLCPKAQSIPPCQYVQPDTLADMVNMRLHSLYSNEVSAVVPIYRPPAERLNRCLTAVLPQVNEVVITMEKGGIVPDGVLKNDRIRYVRKNEDGIGYGRNANFGFRHTHSKFVLILNDDCYLDPDAVEKMMDCMADDVGIVGHFLRYPNGKIYHAGKPRTPGGFFMADHGKFLPEFYKDVTEVENVTGTSLLCRRKAYFDAGCHDEDFQFYAEDDALCMAVRQAGWRIMYTPHATGVHDSHSSTQQVPGIRQIMDASNRLFGTKWNWYIEKNRNNPGLGVFR